MRSFLAACWLVCFSSVCISSVCSGADEFVFQHLNVLGTQFELRLDANSMEDASRAEKAALDEIERLNRILSSYESGSELNRWIAAGRPVAVSPELAEVLRASEKWHRLSGGAFHPGVEAATRVWKQAEKDQRHPDASELSAVTANLAATIGWEWNENGSSV